MLGKNCAPYRNSVPLILIGIACSIVAASAGHASLLTPIITIGQPAANTYYVSNQGNDNWSGTLPAPNPTHTDGPFATLSRARDAVRAQHSLLGLGPLPNPVTVYVRGGTYTLVQPLIFSPQDSGTPSAPVTYAAYQGETPVISGGQQILGWTRYTGSALPPYIANNVWVASIPQVAQGWWYFRQLFVNGQRRIRARTPNEGSYHYIQGVTTTTLPAQFNFYPGDISSNWAAPANVEVITLQAWADTRMTIAAVDQSSRTVTLAGIFSSFYQEPYARYWIENTLDALDAPGEWYLDQKAGLLYYYPMAGEDMTQANVVAPFPFSLVQFQGNAALGQFVTNIQLTGLTFSYADWSLPLFGHGVQAEYDVPAAVTATGARACSISQCVFTHLGGYAVEFSQGSQNNAVTHNEMNDLGAGGVKIGDANVPLLAQSNNNVVTDNRIHDTGKVFVDAVGVWVGESANNTIAHNEIFDTFYTGISVGWTFGFGASAAAGNLVQFNHIHDIGRNMLSDMGCVYTLGAQPGTIVSNNLCHDVSRYWYGGWGLYNDLGSTDLVFKNNVAYNTQDGGFLSHFSQSDSITNNVLAFGRNTQIVRADPTSVQSFDFEHNIVYWTRGEFLQGSFNDSNYLMDNNLYFCPGDCPTFGFPTFGQFFFLWQALGHDPHSIVADPMFVDPAHGNFTLKPGSPASQIGFQPIDLSTVGPRP